MGLTRWHPRGQDQRRPIAAPSPSRCCRSLGLSGSRIPNLGWIPWDPMLPAATFLLQPYFREAKGTDIHPHPHPVVPGSGQRRRAGGPMECWLPSPAPACARCLNGQGSSSSALSDFSNDRSRSLGQVGKAAEPPHAPRHAACKTSEQEGWKPYRIIQGKASRPAPAQPRRREGQERGAAAAPRESGRAEAVLGKKTEIESIWRRHAALGLWREMGTLC